MVSENLVRMNVLHCISAVLALLSLMVLGQHAVTGDTMSTCSTSPNKTMDIQCGPGYMLHILRSFYGYSPSGQCRLVADEEHHGCTEDDDVHYACVGRPSCVINLPPGDHGVAIKSCDNKPSNYFQVDYKCVKESTVYDICREKRLTDETGYIRTPSYPNQQLQQGQCNISIVADPSQQIRLHIIDLQLRDRGHLDCYDYIYFRDTQRSITLCGTRTNTSYVMKSSLHIEVFSTTGGVSKGFWLFYQAYPPLPNSLQRPTVTKPTNNNNNNNNNINNDNNSNNNVAETNTKNGVSHSDPSTASTSQNAQDETNSRGNNQDNNNNLVETTPVYKNNGNTVPLIRNQTRSSSSNLPFAAIAGGVIGTLSLILVILLLLLLIKWLRERRYYKAEKILEIRNPAFRSSGDFYEGQHPNHHHHHHQQHHQHHQQHQHQPNNSHYYRQC